MLQMSNLHVFIVVVDTGGFSEAARKLKISPTAVSKNIKQLEIDLGISLFHRTTRNVQLTENGKQIYEKAKLALSGLEEITNLATALRNEPVGTLKISCPLSIATHFLIPYLAEYLQLYPHTNIDLRLKDHCLINLDKENVDILFGRCMHSITSQEKNIIGIKLSNVDYVLCASNQYIKAHGTPKSLTDLSNHFYIYHKLRQKDAFYDFCQQLNIPLQIKLMVNSTEALVQAILSHVGYGICPRYILDELIRQKKIMLFDHLYKSDPMLVYMFYRKMRYTELKISQFKKFILEKLKP